VHISLTLMLSPPMHIHYCMPNVPWRPLRPHRHLPHRLWKGLQGGCSRELADWGVAQRGAATGTEGQQPSSPRSTLRTVSLEDIGVVAPPDVSAPLPPPPPPLSPVKVQTIPPEYDLTAADMFRLTLCMKLASKTDQIKYSPIKQRTSHNLLFFLHTTLRGDMIGPMLFEGTILLVSWFDKRGAETGEKMGKSQYKAEEVIQ
jgi:hypothetical protein